MKHILMANDMSHRSYGALKVARALAEAHGATLSVVTILDDDLPDSLADEMARSAGTLLHDAAGDIADIRVEFGDPAEALREEADRVEADLIVIGPHRPRVLLDAMRETTAERIVRRSHRPVLLARGAATPPYSRILAPVDFSAASTAALRAAQTMAPDAEIRAIHVVHAPVRRHGIMIDATDAFVGAARAERDAWRDAGRLPDGIAEPEIVVGHLRARVEEEIDAMNADLVALGSHARDGIGHFVLGSFARDMIRDGSTDLLLAP